MIIVSGHITVDAEARAAYLTAHRELLRSAREADGCRDFSLSADELDPSRINVHEQWRDDSALQAFRRRDDIEIEATAPILSMSVEKHEIALSGPP